MLCEIPIYQKNKNCGIIFIIGDKMRKIINKIDKPLLLVTLFCLVTGVLLMGEASMLKAYMSEGDSFFYLKKQITFVIIGIVASIIIIKTPIKKWRVLIYLGSIIVLGALIYILAYGKVMNGMKGWLHIGGFGVQPSEFAKTMSILLMAIIFERLMRIKYVSNVGKVIPFIIPGLYISLVAAQTDLGTLSILCGIIGVIFLVVPYDFKTKTILTGFTMGLVITGIVGMLLTGKGLTSAQQDRLNYKEPCTRYREKSGYQVCNGYIAINSGGLLGSGFGKSKQKYLYLPEAHTDFIFPIIIEELGFIAGVILFLAYFVIIWRIIRIGRKSYNLQGTIICYGVATYIALHIVVNLVGILGLFPLTGVPLPFYSYGGSYMINLLVCLAFVQRCAVENKIFEQKHLVM